MKKLSWASVCLLASIFIFSIMSCKPSVPSEFLSEGEMEDILYDYHLAEAMARIQPDHYDENVITYRTAVLKKYGVSQAEFDTSMVYYMRHTSQLHAIYKRIAQRLEDKAQEYGSTTGAMAGLGRISANGDTADIWKGPNTLALIPNQPYNVHSFSLTPDSTYHNGDSYILMLNSDFIFQDGMRDGIASLVLVFKNDSVASRVLHISSSNQLNITIDDRDSLGVKAIKGYFMLNMNNQANTSSTTLHLMALSNIHLYRCHPKRQLNKTTNFGTPVPNDSARRNPQRIRNVGIAADNQDSVKGKRPIK
ncbi:MAG: DUF4296 domain-containing protein [Prevotella sp.]|nr:DUF4296 domain-containing protein [Prevotella sp.]